MFMGWALVNIALYCSKTKVEFPVIVQTDFHVKPTTKLLGVAFGWVAVAWLGFGVMTI